ncbi:hypothetical protein [Protaetiibacter intestinalis]|uniref:Uncharacterized protein n=1 Tax=Protaetiibacter intestinalis TaxID=2419774 RepID=A0A387B7W5_9MICO|nr:hypothetical protein [Protaetiibacter intestinalis]AYF98447.1 hypothetical protein D7I47_09390 [Protaetiibacter intestinalis]
MITASVIRALAASLPAGVRERYREEWLADAAAAPEAGLSPWSVVGGAFGVALRIDREDPAVSGLPAGRLAYRRTRIALAGAATVLLLLLASFWWSAWTELDGRGELGLAGIAWLGRLILGAAAIVGVVALVSLVGAVRALARARSWRVGVVGLVGAAVALGVLVALAIAAFIPAFGLLLVLPALFVPVILLTIGDPRPQGPALRVGARFGIALASAGAVLAIVTGSLLHVFVWNPLARMPGMTLDEIYAGLAAAGELPSPVIAYLYAGFWALFALVLLVVALVPPRGIRHLLTARRLAGIGVLGVALAAAGEWFLGFGMGMGMADAFATSGADAAVSGLVITLVGIAAAIAAALVGLLPSRRIPATGEMQEIPTASRP